MRKKTSSQKRVGGNSGKRDIPDEYEVDQPSLKYPKKISKEGKYYWDLWAGPLLHIGRLTNLTLPSFLALIDVRVRLDQVNKYLNDNNESFLQESRFCDGAGQEHISYKESAYSKLSRDLTRINHVLEKSWGLTADSMAGLFIPKEPEDPYEKFKNGEKNKEGKKKKKN